MIALRDFEGLDKDSLLVSSSQIFRLHDHVYVVLIHLILFFESLKHPETFSEFHALCKLLLQFNEFSSHLNEGLLNCQTIWIH